MRAPAILIPLSLLLGAPARAQECELNETQRLFPVDGEGQGSFGIAVATDGQTMVVGSPGIDDRNRVDAGAAYIYRLEGGQWVLETKLLAQPTEDRANFGDAVGVQGDFVVIGAVAADADRDDDAGAVYVFRRRAVDDWVQEARITLEPDELVDQQGLLIPSVPEGLGIDGDTILIGGRNWSPGGIQGGFHQAGGAWVYKFDQNGQWVREARIQPDVPQALSQFGFSVDIAGDLAVIGAWREPAGDAGRGAAYIFRREGAVWTQIQRLVAPEHNGGPGPEFASSVATDGERVVIGAFGFSHDLGLGPGAAWVYEQVGGDFVVEQMLLPDPDVRGLHFGLSVDIIGDQIAIGAETDDTGTVYLFSRGAGGWSQSAKLIPSDGVTGERVARAVAIGGSWLLAGAQFHQVGGMNTGAAYILDLATIPPECLPGCPADLDNDGDADADDFFDYLDAFAVGDTAICDIDTDGDCDADDFFGYLDLFAAGC